VIIIFSLGGQLRKFHKALNSAMVEDSDDDKPVLAAIMKSKAIKQEVDNRKVKDVADEKEKKTANGTKAAVVAVSKSSSSSDKPSREKSSSSTAEKDPAASKTSKQKTVVKTEDIGDKSTADVKAIEASKKRKAKAADSDDDLPIAELMKRVTQQKRVAVKVKVEGKKDKKEEEDEEEQEADEEVPEKKKTPRPVADKNSNVPPGLGSEFYLTKKGTVNDSVIWAINSCRCSSYCVPSLELCIRVENSKAPLKLRNLLQFLFWERCDVLIE
jgi:hypothetical protein